MKQIEIDDNKEIFWQKPRIDELSKKYNIHDEGLEH